MATMSSLVRDATGSATATAATGAATAATATGAATAAAGTATLAAAFLACSFSSPSGSVESSFLSFGSGVSVFFALVGTSTSAVATVVAAACVSGVSIVAPVLALRATLVLLLLAELDVSSFIASSNVPTASANSGTAPSAHSMLALVPMMSFTSALRLRATVCVNIPYSRSISV